MPPAPEQPHRHWSGLTLNDGTHHQWLSQPTIDEHKPHVGYMHENGITPEQVRHYLVWDPLYRVWEDLNKYSDDYKMLYNDFDPQEWRFSNWALPEPHPDYKLPSDKVELGDLQPWEPGHHGKFIGYPDGYVHVWRNQPNAYYHDSPDPTMVRDGWPSHDQAAQALGRPLEFTEDYDMPGHTLGFISPDGEISTGLADKNIYRQHVESVKRQHPGTEIHSHPQFWDSEEEGEWHFGNRKRSMWPFTVKQEPFNIQQHIQQNDLRCAVHPDRPAVGGSHFQLMCSECKAMSDQAGGPHKVNWAPVYWQQSQKHGSDDPWHDPEFPADHELDAQEDEWWEGVKPGSHTIHSLSDLTPWRHGKPGKGLVTREGEVITWDNVGIHHQEVAQLLPRGPRDVHMFLDIINDDGSVGLERSDAATEKILQGIGLRPYSLYEQGWSF